MVPILYLPVLSCSVLKLTAPLDGSLRCVQPKRNVFCTILSIDIMNKLETKTFIMEIKLF